MKKYSKGIITTFISFSIIISASITSGATVVKDPFVYDNTTSTAKTSATNRTQHKTVKSAVIYANDYTLLLAEDFYFMKDVYAFDNGGKGDDITDEVTVSGEINTAEVGDYYITYEVIGENGKTITKEITVTVIDPSDIRN